MGSSPNYIFCALDILCQLYDTNNIHPVQLVSRCDECHKSPAVLLLCKRCRDATYCNATCQKKDWRFHKAECHPPNTQSQNLHTVPSLLSSSSPDYQKIIHNHHLGKEAIAWLTDVLDTCNTIVTPCTRLEELNKLVPGSDDSITDLCVDNALNEKSSFSIARLKEPVLRLVITLSNCHILGFECYSPFTWKGIGAYPNVLPDQKFENTIYQAPLRLRNGPSANTGHFRCSDYDEETKQFVVRFYWNRE